MKYKIPKEAKLTFFTDSGWYCSKIDIQSLVDDAVKKSNKNKIAKDIDKIILDKMLKYADTPLSERKGTYMILADLREEVAEYFENDTTSN
jgi:hypothetical protein